MNPITLPTYLSSKVIVVLDDTLIRLSVLRSTNDKLMRQLKSKNEVQNIQPEFSNKRAESASSKETSGVMEERMRVPYSLKIVHIESDRQFVEDCIDKLKRDLEFNGEFTHFSEILRKEVENEESFINQNEMHIKFRNKVDQVQEAVNLFQKDIDRQKMYLGEVLQNLKHQKHELSQKNKMQLKLVEAETHHEIEVAKDGYDQEITLVKNKIKDIFELLSRESNAHKSSMEEFRQGVVSLIVDEGKFIDNYNTRKEEILQSIKYYERNWSELRQKLYALTLKYKEYLSVIEPDRIMKKKLRKEEKQNKFIIDMANVIQDWWRYVLVRDGLLAKIKKKSKPKKKK